jgi:copper chaperone
MGVVRKTQCVRRSQGSRSPERLALKLKILNTPMGYLHQILQEGAGMQNKLALSIEGMHCGACVRRLTTALEGVKGVELGSVEVGLAELRFDPNHSSAKEITSAVDRIGFTAQIKES